MDDADSISVEVVYLEPGRCFLRRVELPRGSSVEDAIRRSGVLEAAPDFPLRDADVGVFSRKVGLRHVLEDDDRVELYRPLRLTPNEIRKLRAQRKRAKRRGFKARPE